jgi:hypothetical protein
MQQLFKASERNLRASNAHQADWLTGETITDPSKDSCCTLLCPSPTICLPPWPNPCRKYCGSSDSNTWERRIRWNDLWLAHATLTSVHVDVCSRGHFQFSTSFPISGNDWLFEINPAPIWNSDYFSYKLPYSNRASRKTAVEVTASDGSDSPLFTAAASSCPGQVVATYSAISSVLILREEQEAYSLRAGSERSLEFANGSTMIPFSRLGGIERASKRTWIRLVWLANQFM